MKQILFTPQQPFRNGKQATNNPRPKPGTATVTQKNDDSLSPTKTVGHQQSPAFMLLKCHSVAGTKIRHCSVPRGQSFLPKRDPCHTLQAVVYRRYTQLNCDTSIYSALVI